MSEDSVLSAKQELYLDWLCTAPSERVPSSKQKFADQHHTTPQTLRNWEKRPAFREEWKSRVDNIQGSPEKTFSLLESLYQRAMTGDMKAADLYLRATNRMTPPPLKVESSTSVRDMSDEDLQKLVASMASAQLERRVTAAPLVDEHLELR